MPRIKYQDIAMSGERLKIVENAITLINTYREQGYALTLRQLYYQFISRDWFPETWKDKTTGSTNNERSYKKLGDILNDARLSGRVDWAAIEDRTRAVAGNSHWDSPADIVEVCGRQYQIDKWQGQPRRVEVWVEKDALEGIVAQAARRADVKYFSCRGYSSATALWDAGQRMKAYVTDHAADPIILHLGDHDPSGIDMTRDIRERVSMFMDGYGDRLTVVRIALNMDQIDQYNPPPNPAKATDTRYDDYRSLHGDECWELDALEPSVLDTLITEKIAEYRSDSLFNKMKSRETAERQELKRVAANWETVVENLPNS